MDTYQRCLLKCTNAASRPIGPRCLGRQSPFIAYLCFRLRNPRMEEAEEDADEEDEDDIEDNDSDAWRMRPPRRLTAKEQEGLLHSMSDEKRTLEE